MTFLLIIFTFVVAIPVWSVASLDDKVVDSFCQAKYDDLPFNMEKYFTENKDMTAKRFDAFLNKPSEVLCSDACPCVAIEQGKWPKKTQAAMSSGALFSNKSAGRTWNFSGSIKNMTECVAHLKNANTDEKYTCFALKTVNESEIARQNKNEKVK